MKKRTAPPRPTELQTLQAALELVLVAARHTTPRARAVFVDLASRQLARDRYELPFLLRRRTA